MTSRSVASSGRPGRGPDTIEATRRRSAKAFAEAGLDSPELDARLLVGHALGLDHAALASAAARALSPAEAAAVEALATRRLAREPVARILGTKEFWGLALRLNADALVPRPDTETVVEAALKALDRSGARMRPLRLLDIGTGSGAILLALLSELPAARGIGTDVSPVALACARANARNLGFRERAAFVACDHGAALQGPFDLVVSNPPYIRHGDIATLDPEVRLFDPARALDGGSDGLASYRAIAADMARLLAPDGTAVVELGAGALPGVGALFAQSGLSDQDVSRDLAGIPRALATSRPGA